MDGADVNCTDEELETFLEKTLVIQNYLSPDSSTVLTDAGIVSVAYLLCDSWTFLPSKPGDVIQIKFTIMPRSGFIQVCISWQNIMFFVMGI